MIIHQPENTSDNCEKHVQVAYVHGKPQVNFLRNHTSGKINIPSHTSKDQIRTDFENIRQESNRLLRKRFIYTQSQVNEMSRVFEYQRWIDSENCKRLASKIGLKPNQVSVIVFYPHTN